MGASVFGIIRMLSNEYAKLVTVSFIFAAPITFYIVSKWLENFAYKTTLSVIVFVVGGLLALFIAWITVAYQCYRAASRNPVDSLRYE